MKITYKRARIKDHEKKEEGKSKEKNPVAEFWDWLWHSDSIVSWIVALLLAFIVVKFIFFPILSLITGTSLPLVVVESSSMEHPGGYLGNLFGTENSVETWWETPVSNAKIGNWYESRDISITDAKSWPLRTGFDKGDIMVVYGRFEPKVGDVIIFNAGTTHPIIHRIVKINEDGTLETKGDNNNKLNSQQFSFEKNIQKEQIIGKAVFRIPKLGWLKLVFVELGKLFTG